MHKIFWDFKTETDHSIEVRKADLILIRKKRTCHLLDFSGPADYRVKWKGVEKPDKYQDLARELNNCNYHSCKKIF